MIDVFFVVDVGEFGEGQENGESGDGDDAVQSQDVQQGEFPVDQVRRQVPSRLVQLPHSAHALIPRRGNHSFFHFSIFSYYLLLLMLLTAAMHWK